MSIQQLLEWLEATPVGVLIKESPWGFPIAVAIHIMGIMLSVGMLVWFDLRLLGVSMTGYRASLMYRRLMPWMFSGFALMFITGLMLVDRVRHGGVRQSLFPHQGVGDGPRRDQRLCLSPLHRAPNR